MCAHTLSCVGKRGHVALYFLEQMWLAVSVLRKSSEDWFHSAVAANVVELQPIL